jgi:DNA-binding sugar fermentation-stimulating protein
VFPHGKRKTGVRVVSTRAVKHVAHLTDVHGTGGGDDGPLVQGCVLFVVNRADCERFRPCHEACPLFAVSAVRLNFSTLAPVYLLSALLCVCNTVV